VAIILFVLLSFSVGRYIAKENDKRTNNIMAKGKQQKDKQYNGQSETKKRQTI
jgi:hypothetical protein